MTRVRHGRRCTTTIGDDIVDLAETTRTPAMQQGFDARVFTVGERARIAMAADASRERWRHWAAKEAAFKALSKRSRPLVFSPSAFEVGPMARCARHGRVIHGNDRVDVRWTEGLGWIHCRAVVASRDGRLRVRVRVRVRIRRATCVQTPVQASADARKAARALLRRLGARDPLVLTRLRGDAGPLHVRHQPAFDMSLSHDGRVVSAAACRTDRTQPR